MNNVEFAFSVIAFPFLMFLQKCSLKGNIKPKEMPNNLK